MMDVDDIRHKANVFSKKWAARFDVDGHHCTTHEKFCLEVISINLNQSVFLGWFL